jgi:hypothetical protein
MFFKNLIFRTSKTSKVSHKGVLVFASLKLDYLSNLYETKKKLCHSTSYCLHHSHIYTTVEKLVKEGLSSFKGEGSTNFPSFSFCLFNYSAFHFLFYSEDIVIWYLIFLYFLVSFSLIHALINHN